MTLYPSGDYCSLYALGNSPIHRIDGLCPSSRQVKFTLMDGSEITLTNNRMFNGMFTFERNNYPTNEVKFISGDLLGPGKNKLFFNTFTLTIHDMLFLDGLEISYHLPLKLTFEQRPSLLPGSIMLSADFPAYPRYLNKGHEDELYYIYSCIYKAILQFKDFEYIPLLGEIKTTNKTFCYNGKPEEFTRYRLGACGYLPCLKDDDTRCSMLKIINEGSIRCLRDFFTTFIDLIGNDDKTYIESKLALFE